MIVTLMVLKVLIVCEHPEPEDRLVIVILVVPVFSKVVVKVPVPETELKVIVAVLPAAVVAPERL